MKVESWDYYVLLFASSEEPVAHIGDVVVDIPGGSGTEFEFEQSTSCDEEPSAARSQPIGLSSSL